MNQPQDVFAVARNRYTISELWNLLRLPGDAPRPGARFRSPFRPDQHPSCDISKDGRWFADRSRSLNLDAVAFVKHALNCDWLEVRLWFMERLGIDHPPGGTAAPLGESPTPASTQIEWPGELLTGTKETWKAFASRYNLSSAGIVVAVQLGVLRFLKAQEVRCYAVTDPTGRTGEIRRCDGGTFRNGQKTYPLRGPDKSWPVSAGLFPDEDKEASVLICEGATDYLAALSAYVDYRRSEGERLWLPLGLLGASCRKLHPELIPWIRGRTVRVAGDGDKPGRALNEAWRDLLLSLGCTVEVAFIPDGRDLRDLLVSGELKPEELFE